MRFIIYTSLTSLLVLLFYILVIKRIYKKIKPGVEATLKVVDSAATTLGNSTSEFMQSLNCGLIEQDAKLKVKLYMQLIEYNDSYLKHMRRVITDEHTQNEMIEKSKSQIEQKYKDDIIDLEKKKIEAISSNNFELCDALDEYEKEIKSCYNEITQLKEFVLWDIVGDKYSRALNELCRQTHIK